MRCATGGKPESTRSVLHVARSLVGIEARARCGIVSAYPSSFREVIPFFGVDCSLVAACPTAVRIRLPHELVPVWLVAAALS